MLDETPRPTGKKKKDENWAYRGDAIAMSRQAIASIRRKLRSASGMAKYKLENDLDIWQRLLDGQLRADRISGHERRKARFTCAKCGAMKNSASQTHCPPCAKAAREKAIKKLAKKFLKK